MFEHSKLLAKGQNEAIRILESNVLSAEVETSELYSLENLFFRILGIARSVASTTNLIYVQVVKLSVSIVALIVQILMTTLISLPNWFMRCLSNEENIQNRRKIYGMVRIIPPI